MAPKLTVTATRQTRARMWLTVALTLFVTGYLIHAVSILSQTPIAWHRLVHWPTFVGVVLIVASLRMSRRRP